MQKVKKNGCYYNKYKIVSANGGKMRINLNNTDKSTNFSAKTDFVRHFSLNEIARLKPKTTRFLNMALDSEDRFKALGNDYVEIIIKPFSEDSVFSSVKYTEPLMRTIKTKKKPSSLVSWAIKRGILKPIKAKTEQKEVDAIVISKEHKLNNYNESAPEEAFEKVFKEIEKDVETVQTNRQLQKRVTEKVTYKS